MGVDGLASLVDDDSSEVSTATRSSLWPSLQHSTSSGGGTKSSSLWQRLADRIDINDDLND